ncbi:hypothetical protein P9112_010508 [Eukaryota sp. TZLM1-RC]
MSTNRGIDIFRISRCAPISDLWGNDSSDFTIIHGDERIPVHERVLVIWSEVFRGWFKHSVEESDKREGDLSEHRYSTDSLVTFLKLLYCQQVVLDEDNVLMVYRWVHYFNVDVVMNKCVAMMKKLLVNSAEWRRAFIQTVIENDDHDLVRPTDSVIALLLDLTDEIHHPPPTVKFVSYEGDYTFNEGNVYVNMAEHCTFGAVASHKMHCILRFQFCIEMMQGNVALRFTEDGPQSLYSGRMLHSGVQCSYSFPNAVETDITIFSPQHPDFNEDNSILCDEKDIIDVNVASDQLTISNVRTKQTETRFRTESGTLDFCLIGSTVLRLLD